MSNYTVTTAHDIERSDPFHIVVYDSAKRPVVEMSALSLIHSEDVARDMALLLRRLRPGQPVILEPLQIGSAAA
jgi:hypothetical protein